MIFALRKNEPVVIETPEGLIRIRRGSQKHHIEIELPKGMSAWVGESRALEHARFVEKKDGAIVPTFDLLAPKMEDGALVGVQRPSVIGVKL